LKAKKVRTDTYASNPQTEEDQKVRDDGLLIQLLCFWRLSIVLLFYVNTKHFGDWILSPSSGEAYSVGPNG
jgi:hypothetical protein